MRAFLFSHFLYLAVVGVVNSTTRPFPIRVLVVQPVRPETGGTGGTAGNGGTAGSSGEGGTGGTAGSSGTGGVGGEAGDAGPDATGGTAGDAGSGGAGGSGGNAGSGGDAGPEADATDPCSVPVTAQEVADMLGVDCATYFGASCGTVDVITRSDVVVAVVDQVPPELFQGYAYSATNLPTLPPYSDVPFSHPNLIQIDLAKWLGAIGDAVKFFPDDPALTCWTQEVVDRANDLPTFYLVPSVNTADGNLGAAAGPVTTTRYLLYGTSSSTHLTSLRVVNNLQANFTLSQPTNALEAVVVRCEVPSGGSYTPYSLPLAASGQADFGSLDCYSQTGGAYGASASDGPRLDRGGSTGPNRGRPDHLGCSFGGDWRSVKQPPQKPSTKNERRESNGKPSPVLAFAASVTVFLFYLTHVTGCRA